MTVGRVEAGSGNMVGVTENGPVEWYGTGAERHRLNTEAHVSRYTSAL